MKSCIKKISKQVTTAAALIFASSCCADEDKSKAARLPQMKAHWLYVVIDTETGCQYLHFADSRGPLTARIDVDGKTHMGCGQIPKMESR